MDNPQIIKGEKQIKKEKTHPQSAGGFFKFIFDAKLRLGVRERICHG